MDLADLYLWRARRLRRLCDLREVNVASRHKHPEAEADIGEFLMYLLGWLAVLCFAASLHLLPL